MADQLHTFQYGLCLDTKEICRTLCCCFASRSCFRYQLPDHCRMVMKLLIMLGDMPGMHQSIQERNFTKFLGGVVPRCLAGCHARLSLPVTFLILVTVVHPMVLCPVDCPAEIHLLTFLPCEMAKFPRLGKFPTPIPPLSFVPGSIERPASIFRFVVMPFYALCSNLLLL